eukprot:8410163-Alexandrium_andersonii.AAC.1
MAARFPQLTAAQLNSKARHIYINGKAFSKQLNFYAGHGKQIRLLLHRHTMNDRRHEHSINAYMGK